MKIGHKKTDEMWIEKATNWSISTWLTVFTRGDARIACFTSGWALEALVCAAINAPLCTLLALLSVLLTKQTKLCDFRKRAISTHTFDVPTFLLLIKTPKRSSATKRCLDILPTYHLQSISMLLAYCFDIYPYILSP